ncbi:uncharacterized protein LOC131997869 [Stomoxys calcitrans]|uniref:uncharacterized protein LOC131997869 n=1 Tax=Stomoxys calcitrans TaxID=35570 RepID=UPI0027E38FB6|nr:uncharacterized protein LOC131997869 [Stomoxys calcitrans]
MCSGITPRVLTFVIIILTQCNEPWSVLVNTQEMTCIIRDKNFTDFQDCGIRLDKQKGSVLNLTIKLLQLPVTNCMVHLDILHLAKSKEPRIVYQGDWEGCEFLRNRRRFKFLSMIYDPILTYTNINHTCPYWVGGEHDLHVTNFPAGKIHAPIPIPIGQYKLITQYFVDKILRHEIWFTFKAS